MINMFSYNRMTKVLENPLFNARILMGELNKKDFSEEESNAFDFGYIRGFIAALDMADIKVRMNIDGSFYIDPKCVDKE